MEHNDPSRRQYAHPAYPAQQEQQRHAPHSSGQFATPTPQDRLRQQSFVQQSPTAVAGPARAGSDAQNLYGFSQGAQFGVGPSMSANQLQYEQQYTAQDTTQRGQSQNYPQYGPNVLYSMQQQAASTQQQQQQQQHPAGQATYEQVQQYRQRPSVTSHDHIPTHFGEAAHAAHYFLGAQQAPTAAPTSDFAGTPMVSHYQSAPYPQQEPSASHSLSGAMIDPTQSTSYQPYTSQAPYAAGQPAVQDISHADQSFGQYKNTLRTVFVQVHEGALRDVPQHLLDISRYLLDNAESLGLTRDEEGQHERRISIWDEFNRAWLTTLQCQHDLMRDMLSGQTLHDTQSIISQPSLEHLAREIVRLCDSVEKFGLVDYQMGVAEEEIIDAILRCLSLMDTSGSGGSEPAETTSAGASR